MFYSQVVTENHESLLSDWNIMSDFADNIAIGHLEESIFDFLDRFDRNEVLEIHRENPDMVPQLLNRLVLNAYLSHIETLEEKDSEE